MTVEKKVLFLSFHGMGDTEADFYRPLTERLTDFLGDNWRHVLFKPVYYQPLLQRHQEAIFRDMRSKHDLDAIKLRRFFLYSFSDAASLEYQRQEADTPYHLSQTLIAKTLAAAYQEVGNQALPVVIHCQSLGCQLLNNYLWDASHEIRNISQASGGYWRHGPASLAKWPEIPADIRNADVNATPIDYLKLRGLRSLITTGCNIPIFVAGHEQIEAIPKAHFSAGFDWTNLYDEDDVLGWPLGPLSESYRDLVNDVAINANQGLLGAALKSWNPLSHGQYWGDKDVVKQIGRALMNAIS